MQNFIKHHESFLTNLQILTGGKSALTNSLILNVQELSAPFGKDENSLRYDALKLAHKRQNLNSNTSILLYIMEDVCRHYKICGYF